MNNTSLALKCYFIDKLSQEYDINFVDLSIKLKDVCFGGGGRPHGLTRSAVGYRSIAPGFKSRPGYVSRMFKL